MKISVFSIYRHDLTNYRASDRFVCIMVAMNHALLDKHGVILHVKSSKKSLDGLDSNRARKYLWAWPISINQFYTTDPFSRQPP